MTVLFRPMGLIAGLIAGLVARKIFEQGWSSLSDEDPPSPDEESLSLGKLVLALLLEGAVFSLVRGLTDHGARVAFRRYTGAWPGETGKDN
ncbi:MAG TPA: DUF4235 domain-containing protein [Solirubrobacterales bacterium]|nr:DUF4235 domain-containing protein [Solirubrobacterales bacterium]